jgi:hypothetical protein
MIFIKIHIEFIKFQTLNELSKIYLFHITRLLNFDIQLFIRLKHETYFNNIFHIP